MQLSARNIAAMALVVSMVMPATFAQTGSTTARKSTASSRRKPAPSAQLADEIRQLRESIAAQQQQMQQQQQQIQALQQQVQQASQQSSDVATRAQSAAEQAQTRATAAESALTESNNNLSKVQSDLADVKLNQQNAAVSTQEDQKRVGVMETAVNRFRWTGDVRVRQEDFFFGCAASARCHPRIRERIRVRFGFEGRLGDDFLGGLSLATGVLTDPTSTNETLANFFEKKTIGLDRGYITYAPMAHKWLSLTGGKFAYTWIRTPQSFDSDLNPEGFSEKLSFDMNHGALKNLTLTGMQLLFNESSSNAGTGLNLFKGADSYSTGGQASAKLQLTKRWTLQPSYSLLNWHNADVILNASPFTNGNGINANNTVGPFAPNGNTNAVTFTPLAGGVCPNPATGSGNCIGHYLSKFLYSDLILNNTIKTMSARFPWNLLLEYEDNLNAYAGQKDRHAYLADTSFGQQKEKHDLQFGYAFLRQEQDSVISAFNESDQRAPTNVLQHRVYIQWKPSKNTQLAATDWIGRTLNSRLAGAALTAGTVPGTHEPFTKRLQFDVIYSF